MITRALLIVASFGLLALPLPARAQTQPIAATTPSPAVTAADKTKADPRTAFSGRTDSEDNLLVNLPSQGGVDALGLRAIDQLRRENLGTVFIGTPKVDGPLTFELIWLAANTDLTCSSNLYLRVTDPQGRVASKDNLTIGSGSRQGIHSGDDP